MAHRTVYLNDALAAQLELEERAGGKAFGIALARGALLDLIDGGAPEGTVAGRLVQRLRLVTVTERVLAALGELGTPATAVAIAERAGLEPAVVAETLHNLSRIKDETEKKALVTAMVAEGGGIVWNLTA